MKTFTIVATTLVGAALTAGVVGAGVVYSGVYNVGADEPHLDATYWVLNTARERSVEVHAADIKTPPLGSQDQLLQGAATFNEMCVGCHIPPGGQMTAAAQGMYPAPADLMKSGKEMEAKEIYWILQHGIKPSGMPAWGPTHEPDELWAVTALVKAFPSMSNADYQRLVQTAKASGKGHHGGDGGDAHGQSEAGHHGSDGENEHVESEAGHHDRDSDDHGSSDTETGHDDGHSHAHG